MKDSTCVFPDQIAKIQEQEVQDADRQHQKSMRIICMHHPVLPYIQNFCKDLACRQICLHHGRTDGNRIAKEHHGEQSIFEDHAAQSQQHFCNDQTKREPAVPDPQPDHRDCQICQNKESKIRKIRHKRITEYSQIPLP